MKPGGNRNWISAYSVPSWCSAGRRRSARCRVTVPPLAPASGPNWPGGRNMLRPQW